MVGATASKIVMLVPGNPATGQVLPGRSFGTLCETIISRWRNRVRTSLHSRSANSETCFGGSVFLAVEPSDVSTPMDELGERAASNQALAMRHAVLPITVFGHRIDNGSDRKSALVG